MHYLQYACIIWLVFGVATNLRAQTPEDPFPTADTLGILGPNDTIPPNLLPPLDTATLAADSVLTDSITVQQEGDIETTITYDAEDSIKFDVINQVILLYGNATINYGETSLQADYVELDWINNMLMARGREDSTGQVTGKPIFKDGGEEYQTEEIRYNFDTRRAYISGVLTQPEGQGAGYVYGETVKKNERDEVFINKGWYTTCDCEPGEIPDFYIQSKRLKVVPGNLVVSGPFNVVITDIPTPLGLPFGIFPMPREQNSGIIIPQYGEEQRRGFFLRNGGYYFDINEYVNLTLLGEIYSKGSYGFTVNSQYRKRYAYNGGLDFRFNQQRVDPDSEDSEVARDCRIKFRHDPQARGVSRFSASINAATSTYNQNNPSLNVQQNLNTTLSSSVQYSTAFRNTPFNMALSARHNQNLLTGTFNVLLPDISVNMNRIYPFQNIAKRRTGWLAKINVGYRMQGRNEFTNERVRPPTGIPDDQITGYDPILGDSILAINGDNLPQILRRTETGMRHTIPISTSFNVLKNITASPSFNYEEIWYLNKFAYNDDDPNNIVIDTLQGFHRVNSWSASMSFSTRIYGTVPFKRGGSIQAIRHTIIPSISIGYTPDYEGVYYDNVRIGPELDSISDPLWQGRDRNLINVPLYDERVYRAPNAGNAGSVGFSLGNNLEMKVRDKKDTTDAENATKKIPIFESLQLSTSYNFVADSFRLAPLNISARTRLLDGKVSINGGATVDPYLYIPDPLNPRDTTTRGEIFERFVKYDQYAWQRDLAPIGEGNADAMPDFSLGTLSRASFNISTRLQPKAKENKEDEVDPENDVDPTVDELNQLELVGPAFNDYADFDVAWSLQLRYAFNYRRDLRKKVIEPARRENDFAPEPTASPFTQSLQFSGDANLTPKWKVRFQSGYDFEREEITQTNVTIFRDLDCFDFRFDWVPFGRFTSYYVQINVKSSMLSDLKLQRRRVWRDFF
ncbi:MAG: putative LPS assembly protein LptD [Tunicatimonas sp.]|uniref:putative LPS assembly protein LptD n=1 Tax=Tunicatimonas sp. TaxID=1940096 RepID=UPI003C72BD89